MLESDKTTATVGLTNPNPPRGWFPLRFDLAQSAAFKQLSPVHKVILADVIYRVSQHLGLYAKGCRSSAYFVEGDAKWAARVAVSVARFRAARRLLGLDIIGKSRGQRLNLFDYRPGFADRERRRFATAYLGGKYCQVRKGEGVRCAAIDRATWRFLIAALKAGRVGPADLSVYLTVAYLWEALGGSAPGKQGIALAKSEIQPLTGIGAGPFMKSLTRLAALELSPTDDSVRLLNFQATRQAAKWFVEITGWRPIADLKRQFHGSL